MATSNTIFLKGRGQVKEANAGGAITPGHLLNRNTAGSFVVHAAAGGNASPIFAMEKDYVGKEISVAYASGERVQALYAAPGDEVYALVPASAAAIVVGDFLESNGDGTLKKYVARTVAEGGAASYEVFDRRIVARAIEAVDNSAGGSAARIRVEVV